MCSLRMHDSGSVSLTGWLYLNMTAALNAETSGFLTGLRLALNRKQIFFYRKVKIPEEKARRSVNFAGPDAAINPEKLYVLPMMKACLMSETYSTGSTLNRV